MIDAAPDGRWWRFALRDTLMGLILGVATSCTLLWLEHGPFGELEDYGIDAGLRAKVAIDRLKHVSGAMPVDEKGRREASAPSGTYIFLDVDPEFDESAPDLSSSQAVCNAMADASRVALSGPAPELDCQAGRPINRILLAELVKGLRLRGARLIVLDVALGRESGVVPSDEADVLDGVLAKPLALKEAPVIFAAPVSHLTLPPGGRPQVQLEHMPVSSGAGIAIPEPGQPVRRYGHSLKVEGSNERWLTLPYLGAQKLKDEPGARRVSCAPQDDGFAPRILYTLPPMSSHEDSRDTRGRDEWAYYRSVYNRCLASRFWDRDRSACGVVEDQAHNAYAGRVVVVGASNPLRRDVHGTPLGEMAGAEVVINAMRSFDQYPCLHDDTTGELVVKKVMIVALCACVWFLFHAWRYRTAPLAPAKRTWIAKSRRGLQVAFGFWLTLIAVLALTLYASLRTTGPIPSLDIFLGVLAISVEQYVEVAQWGHHVVKSWLERLLGLSTEATRY
ncbi:MAG TPA: CHASE2 domain-containing protein [Albitalea sp.]|uniref:CHASE2 domain-containing protein n=1 Tax=Piscinibacter sp. TaxID=1903157 RepID=UPI002ED5A158